MKITREGILMGRQSWDDLTEEQKANGDTTIERVNQLLAHYPGTTKLNDGIRRPEDKPKNGSATSWHYRGAAVDLDDDDSAQFWNWMKDNLPLLKQYGLWIEDPRWTHGSIGTWMHFQIFAPKSGRRIFVPSTDPASAPDLWDGKYDHSLDG